MQKFIVETKMRTGWENTWTEDNGKPSTFCNLAEAKEALKEHLENLAGAGMGAEYHPADFRVVGAV